MTLQPRERRALAFLAVSGLLTLIYSYWSTQSPATVVASSADSTAISERRLAKLREIAATVPAKDEILAKVKAELATREKGLIVADTAPQAQAQLIQIVRGLARAEAPPVEIRTEAFGIRSFGDAYGEASISVQFDCRIDQLLNLLAALTNQRELLATSDIRVSSANAKNKMIGVRLTVSGVVPRKLVPEKKGATAF
jgi:hypothetical protein